MEIQLKYLQRFKTALATMSFFYNTNAAAIENGETFTVGFPQKGVKSSFYVSGKFLTEIKWEGMPLFWRIVLPEQKEFMGTGYQATSHAREPQVAIGDLSLATRLDITRAVAAGENVVVENIP